MVVLADLADYRTHEIIGIFAGRRLIFLVRSTIVGRKLS